MIGIEALAFFNPDLSQVDGIFAQASQAVERPLVDFDRSNHRSLTKKQVSDAIKKTDIILDSVKKQCAEGNKLILALKSGTQKDIDSIEINEDSAEILKNVVAEITRGNLRMAYTFLSAETHEAWRPHLNALRYIKTRALQTFEDYKKITNELYELVSLYQIKSSEQFSYDIDAISSSIASNTVDHPEWVTSGEDFVNWIESMRKDS